MLAIRIADAEGGEREREKEREREREREREGGREREGERERGALHSHSRHFAGFAASIRVDGAGAAGRVVEATFGGRNIEVEQTAEFHFSPSNA